MSNNNRTNVPTFDSGSASATPDGILARLTAELDSFSPQLKKAAGFILDNPNEVGGGIASAAIVALYTEDGLMTRPTAPDAPIVGRKALMEAFTARPPRISRHVCANIVVEVTSETEASAFSVILLFTGKEADDGGLPIKGEGGPLVGTYHDKFKKTDEGWRFAERRGGLCFRP